LINELELDQISRSDVNALKSNSCCRRQTPTLENEKKLGCEDEENVPTDVLEEEQLLCPNEESEIDLILDTLEEQTESGPDPAWEEKVKGVRVRTPNIPSAEQQKERIAWILGLLDSEKPEPEPEQVTEALHWLENLDSLFPTTTS
jgi:hypothetical protein